MSTNVNFRINGRLEKWYKTLECDNKSEILRELLRLGIEQTGINKENYSLINNNVTVKEEKTEENTAADIKNNTNIETTNWNFPE